jgi:pSer/pThr/pTyr-binding forkhead associated (FHA) protein
VVYIMSETKMKRTRTPPARPDLQRVQLGLRRLLKLGRVSPDAVLGVDELAGLPAAFGFPERGPEAAIAVGVALQQVVDSSSDRDALRLLFGIDQSTSAKALGERRMAAARIMEVTPDSFRVRREARILDDLARSLVVELATTAKSAHAAPSARLEVTNAISQSVIRLAPARSPIVVGRSPECDIEVRDDPMVSREHARLFVRAGRWMIEDLGSANGTEIEAGAVTRPVALEDHDTITIGRTRLVFQVAPDDMLATAREEDFTDVSSLSATQERLLLELLDHWRRSDHQRPELPSANDLSEKLNEAPRDITAALHRLGSALGVEATADEPSWYPDLVRRALVLGVVDQNRVDSLASDEH